MTFGEIVDAVINEGGVDTTTSGVTRTQVKAWVNDRYRSMVAEAKWIVSELEIGPTVAAQAAYVVPATVVDVTTLIVTSPDGASPWQRINEQDFFGLRAGTLRWDGGPGGVFAPHPTGVQLWPTPATSGYPITAIAAVEPTDLSADADVPVVPVDFHKGLIDGALAIALERVDERLDEAPYFAGEFEKTVARLTRRKISRIGSGPAQMRVKGIHW